MTWTVTISISGGGGKLGQEVGEEDEENKLQFIGKHKRWWDRVSLLTISQNCIPFESFVFTLAWLRLSFWVCLYIIWNIMFRERKRGLFVHYMEYNV